MLPEIQKQFHAQLIKPTFLLCRFLVMKIYHYCRTYKEFMALVQILYVLNLLNMTTKQIKDICDCQLTRISHTMRTHNSELPQHQISQALP